MRGDIRALSVKQPWASLIASGIKTLEVRSWSTDHRGDLCIVSGRAPSETPKARDWCVRIDDAPGPVDRTLPLGVSVCIVELVDVRMGRKKDYEAAGRVDPRGSFVWVLRNVRRTEHVPVTGRLGLWLIEPPPHSNLCMCTDCLPTPKAKSCRL